MKVYNITADAPDQPTQQFWFGSKREAAIRIKELMLEGYEIDFEFRIMEIPHKKNLLLDFLNSHCTSF